MKTRAVGRGRRKAQIDAEESAWHIEKESSTASPNRGYVAAICEGFLRKRGVQEDVGDGKRCSCLLIETTCSAVVCPI